MVQENRRQALKIGTRNQVRAFALLPVAVLPALWLLWPAGSDEPPAARPVGPGAVAPAPVAEDLRPAAPGETPARPPPTTTSGTIDTVEPPPVTEESNALATPAQGTRDTMFLTIIGDQTFITWGAAGDRPPRFDVEGAQAGSRPALASSSPAITAQPGAGFVIEDRAAAVLQAEMTNPDFRPEGPAPPECPRTLPPGSDQATADALRSQAGCRYLSSCSADSNECSWYYQGRG